MSPTARDTHALYRETRIKQLTASATLDLRDRTVIVDTVTLTITLPNVIKAAGKIFSITVKGANTNNVTVQDNNDEAWGWSDITMDKATSATLALYSDGIRWVIVESNYT